MPKPGEIRKIGDEPQLFTDFEQVELFDNIVRVFHSAEKHPENPVLRKVKPWETARGTWGSVIYDENERLFKAWYGGESGRPVSQGGASRHVMLYATSLDGVRWDRPNLRLFEIMGTRDNNTRS